MTILATSPSSRLNYGPYLMTITTAPSKVAYMHCTRIQHGQEGVSAITRWPTAFIDAHELGWASTRSRPIWNNSIVIATTTDTKFCKWLQQLCPDSGYEAELEEDPVGEDEDGGGFSIDEFDSVDLSEGVDGMHDEDIFEAEEVMDESNIYE